MAGRAAILKKADLKRYGEAMQEAGFKHFRIVARPDGTHEIIVEEVEGDRLGPDPDELLK